MVAIIVILALGVVFLREMVKGNYVGTGGKILVLFLVAVFISAWLSIDFSTILLLLLFIVAVILICSVFSVFTNKNDQSKHTPSDNILIWDKVREGVHTVTINGQTHNFLNDWDINESENYWNSKLSFDDYLVKHYIDWGRGFGNLCQQIIDKDGKSILASSSDFEARKLFKSYPVEKLKELKDLKIKYAVGSTSIGGVRKGYIEILYPDYSNNSTFQKAKDIQRDIEERFQTEIASVKYD